MTVAAAVTELHHKLRACTDELQHYSHWRYNVHIFGFQKAMGMDIDTKVRNLSANSAHQSTPQVQISMDRL